MISRKQLLLYWPVLPFSWLYGLAVWIRNLLFKYHLLPSRRFDLPVICIGNITVGGTGKTPHTEYLIRLLQPACRVAVLSRGYKRASKGFVLATPNTSVKELGDEPFQMKQKFGSNILVAVDKDRCHGIGLLQGDPYNQPDVVLLDDAYQHRYVQPGLTILLTNYHRPIYKDLLLPAGRLRESANEKKRAQLVVVTKCPVDLSEKGMQEIEKQLKLRPDQKLFFSTFRYGETYQLFGTHTLSLSAITPQSHLLLLTGIATPRQLLYDLRTHTSHITSLAFGDHHAFSPSDVDRINETYIRLCEANQTLIFTTEKDATRLQALKGLNEAVRANLYVLTIEVTFLRNQEQAFNTQIQTYVRKNSRNRPMA